MNTWFWVITPRTALTEDTSVPSNAKASLGRSPGFIRRLRGKAAQNEMGDIGLWFRWKIPGGIIGHREYKCEQDAGPNDEERGHATVPNRTPLPRSSSSVSFALGGRSSTFMPQQIRKQVYELTLEDLVAFPAWEFALDEEGEPDQDEATVRPFPFS